HPKQTLDLRMITNDRSPVNVIDRNVWMRPTDRIGGLESPTPMIVTRDTRSHDELVGAADIEGHAHNRVTSKRQGHFCLRRIAATTLSASSRARSVFVLRRNSTVARRETRFARGKAHRVGDCVASPTGAGVRERFGDIPMAACRTNPKSTAR